MFNDYVEKVYRNVPKELVERVKAERYGFITVKTVPMKGSRDTFRLTIRADKHSWYASSLAFAEFISYLTESDRTSLNLYRD